MKIRLSFFLLILSFLVAASASAQISVYASPNDIESAEASGIAGVSTETFNGLATGTNAVNGYYSSTLGATYTSSSGGNIKSNDKYGGDAEGNYLAVTPGTSTTLTLNPGTSAQYFGFYFTAGDTHNQIAIYSGNTLLLNFTTANLINMIPNTVGTTIMAINGSIYNTRDYYGQPVTNQNNVEPYAYLHFISTGSVTFDKIVMTQAGGNSAIFENDNHSIRTTSPIVPSSLVEVPITVTVPEPTSAVLLALGGCFMLGRRKR